MSSTRETTNRPGDRLVQAGGVIFAIGAVATLTTFIPLFIGTEPLPSAAYALSMLMGVGMALAGAGLLRSMAVQRRAVRAAVARQADQPAQ